jgi:hypothetical protein
MAKVEIAKIKLNPVRISIPKYGNGLMLAIEYLARVGTVLPTGIYDIEGENRIEIKLPYTKHSIRHIRDYINNNLPEN